MNKQTRQSEIGEKLKEMARQIPSQFYDFERDVYTIRGEMYSGEQVRSMVMEFKEL